jgi:3-phosphoshikimate 1-carboxyvinyltransferase
MTDWSSTSRDPLPVPSGGRVAGRLRVPSSKSITHRYCVLALLARAPLVIARPLLAEDTRLFLGALERCGFAVDERADEVRLIPGTAPSAEVEIACGNAGTLLRLLVAALTAVPRTFLLDGTPRLRERPVGPLVDALRLLGARIEPLGREGHVPLRIHGGTLRGGATRIDAGESSQYLSALLLAGLAAPGPVTVEVSALTSEPYVDVTRAAAAEFGGRIERIGQDGTVYRVAYRVIPGLAPPARVEVEGDFSAACYPAAAAALTGGHVTLDGLRAGSPQGDRGFLDLLERMGAAVSWLGDELTVRGTGRLVSIDADLSGMPDQVPTLAALAPFAHGTTRITNVAHLRIKESDRLAAMAGELRRLGVPVEEGPDSLTLPGVWADAAPPANPIVVDSHGDHRIAMSLALVGLRRPGVQVAAPAVVGKSYPAFWRDLVGLTAAGAARLTA